MPRSTAYRKSYPVSKHKIEVEIPDGETCIGCTFVTRRSAVDACRHPFRPKAGYRIGIRGWSEELKQTLRSPWCIEKYGKKESE